MADNKQIIQLVNWFPYWKGIRFFRWEDSMRFVYEWSIVLGFIEIRKWQTKSLEELR